jgi:hypothetical protein
MTHPSPADYPPAAPDSPAGDEADGAGGGGRARRAAHRRPLVVLAGLLAICCAGSLVGGFALVRAVQGIGSPAREAADAFLADLVAGRVDAAYDRLCARTQRDVDRARFAAVVAARPITGYEIEDVSAASFGSRGAAVVSTRLTLADGRVVEQTVPMSQESDEWRVCGDPY